MTAGNLRTLLYIALLVTLILSVYHGITTFPVS